MLAPDGRCKTLDSAADGYVRAEAVGLLALRVVTSLGAGLQSPEDSAAAQPHVLLLGTAVNQDGRSSSLTAPSGPAQQALVKAALHSAHLPAHRVRHVRGGPRGHGQGKGRMASVCFDLFANPHSNLPTALMPAQASSSIEYLSSVQNSSLVRACLLLQVDVLQLHGTGTSLGDPIEMNAALTVLAGKGRVDGPLAITAHKASTGHTEPAAGM